MDIENLDTCSTRYYDGILTCEWQESSEILQDNDVLAKRRSRRRRRPRYKAIRRTLPGVRQQTMGYALRCMQMCTRVALLRQLRRLKYFVTKQLWVCWWMETVVNRYQKNFFSSSSVTDTKIMHIKHSRHIMPPFRWSTFPCKQRKSVLFSLKFAFRDGRGFSFSISYESRRPTNFDFLIYAILSTFLTRKIWF